MRKATVLLMVLMLVAVTGAAYAHMYPMSGGHMDGYGGGPGGPDRGWYGGAGIDPKVFAETRDLRKEIHAKQFDLMEAVRAGDEEKADAIEKELDALRDKLSEKPGFKKGKVRGFAGRGCGGGCGGGCGY